MRSLRQLPTSMMSDYCILAGKKRHRKHIRNLIFKYKKFKLVQFYYCI